MSILAGTAAAALLANVSAAQADGADAHRMAGTLSMGYAYTDYDFSGAGLDTDTFSGSGAFLMGMGGNWNFQPGFSFQSQRFDAGGTDAAVDAWSAGVNLFWRDAQSGLFGIEAAFQSADIGIVADGYRFGARGELFASDKFTIGAAAGYQELDIPIFGTVDGFYANGFATWYASDRFGLSLKLEYADADASGLSPKDFGVGGEAEYLCGDAMSLAGGVQYGDLDVAGVDGEAWQIYAGLKVRFGSDGTLVNQHRSNTVEPSMTGFRHLVP
jgi:hypothetical protein